MLPVSGYTALHVAAIKQSLTLTRQLLELGADPNVLLGAGADPSARAPDGASAREIALAEGKTESVSALDRWQAAARSV